MSFCSVEIFPGSRAIPVPLDFTLSSWSNQHGGQPVEL